MVLQCNGWKNKDTITPGVGVSDSGVGMTMISSIDRVDRGGYCGCVWVQTYNNNKKNVATYSSCIFINNQMIQFGVKCICMRDSSGDCCITSYCCIVTIITNASTVTA